MPFKKDDVRRAAVGRWEEVMTTIGIGDEFLDGKHGPCPKCGGTDRFRVFLDFTTTGGMLCGLGGCDKNCADGFESVRWFLGVGFKDAIQRVADILGMKPVEKQDPLKSFRTRELSEMLAAFFCQNNPGITFLGLQRMGAVHAAYLSSQVVAFPVCAELCGDPTNWVVMDAMKPTLIHWNKAGERTELRKKTLGKGTGLMGMESLRLLASGGVETCWKCEGPTDCAALLGAMGDNFGAHVAVTNPHGAGESPRAHVDMVGRATKVVVVNDPDDAGQSGARKWVEALTATGKTVVNVVLPGGLDLRDFIASRGDGAFQELLQLVQDYDVSSQFSPVSSQLSAENSQLTPKLRIPDDDRQILDDLALEVICQDDQGRIVVYSRATKIVSTIRSIDRLQRENLVQVGGRPCRDGIASTIEDVGAECHSIKSVRTAIGIAASQRFVADVSDHCGPGIYAINGDLVLCNGNHLSILAGDGQWSRTDRPFHGDRIFHFGGKQWYDHEQLGELIVRARTDFPWCNERMEAFRAVIDRWTLGNQATDPLLITGLVMASFVQQVWKWRPQVAVRGASGTGKTQLFEFLFGSIDNLGIFGLMSEKLSISSAAGIRQQVKSDSRILGIDEWDQWKKKGEMLGLIRTAGHGDKLALGTTQHKAIKFGLKGIVWLTGIHVSLDEEADANRFIEIEIMRYQEPRKSAYRTPTSQEVESLRWPLLAIALAYGFQAASIAVQAARDFRSNRNAINDRSVENISVPAAMLSASAGFGLKETISTMDVIAKEIGKEQQIVATHDEMLADILRLTIVVGNQAQVSVEQVVNGDASYSGYEKQIEIQVGVIRRFDDSGDWLIVHPGTVAKKFRSSKNESVDKWSEGVVRQVLSRIDGSKRLRVRLAGPQVRCIFIPWSYIESSEIGLQNEHRGF